MSLIVYGRAGRVVLYGLNAVQGWLPALVGRGMNTSDPRPAQGEAGWNVLARTLKVPYSLAQSLWLVDQYRA